MNTTLKEASVTFNDLMHDKIKNSSDLTSTDSSLLNIDKELGNTNSLLLNF